MTQLLYHGDTITHKDNEFEVTGVTYQETNGERTNFSYTVRLASEVKEEREAAEEALKVLSEQKEAE